MTTTAVEKKQNDELASLKTNEGMDNIIRAAKILAASKLIPETFRNNVPDCVIALEMSQRLGVPTMMVMQNLYIVHGKPGWSSQFIIAAINSTGKFSPLRFDVTGSGDEKQCVAYATEIRVGERLESPPVSIGMAKKEGWYGRNGSKWQNMPDLMLRYRTATLFGRLYAPEVLMGMRAEEEIIDIESSEIAGGCALPAMPREAGPDADPEPPEAGPDPGTEPPEDENPAEHTIPEGSDPKAPHPLATRENAISVAQLRRLYAIGGAAGWDGERLKAEVALTYPATGGHLYNIAKGAEYNAIVSHVEMAKGR